MDNHDHPKVRYARNMSRPRLHERILAFYNDSFVLQLLVPAVALILSFGCFQIVFIVDEFNPRNVTGAECKFPGMEAHYKFMDDKPIQVVEVDQEWRMTLGGNAPVLLETGKGSDEFKIYLPQGNYTVAYRYLTKPYYYDDFKITSRSTDGITKLAIHEIIPLLDSSWVANRQRFFSDNTVYTFWVDAPGQVKWCIEIGRSR